MKIRSKKIKIIILLSALFIAAVSAVDSKIIQNLEFFESLDALESNDQETIISISQDEELKLEDVKEVNYED